MKHKSKYISNIDSDSGINFDDICYSDIDFADICDDLEDSRLAKYFINDFKKWHLLDKIKFFQWDYEYGPSPWITKSLVYLIIDTSVKFPEVYDMPKCQNFICEFFDTLIRYDASRWDWYEDHKFWNLLERNLNKVVGGRGILNTWENLAENVGTYYALPTEMPKKLHHLIPKIHSNKAYISDFKHLRLGPPFCKEVAYKILSQSINKGSFSTLKKILDYNP